MICPVVHGAAGRERIVEVAMEALHQTIGLQMVGCCLGMLHVEQVAPGGPQGVGKLDVAV